MPSKKTQQTALEQCDQVFVYGTLKQHHGNNDLLRTATYIGKSTLPQSKKGFYMASLGAFPVVIQSNNPELEHEVHGEVYQIDSEETMQALDFLEGYPEFYQRQIINTDEYGPAWIYFMYEDNNRFIQRLELVEGGNW